MINGGVIGKINTPNTSVATGVWSLREHFLYNKNNSWPRTPPTSVTFVDSSTSLTTSITIPAGSQSGDLAVLFDIAIQSSTSQPTTVVPTDFNTIVNTGFSGNFACRGIFSYKILTESDPGASITGMDGTFSERKILAVFRPNSGKVITSVQLSTPSSELTDGNPVAQSISMSGSSPVIIGFVGYGNGSLQIDPRTATGATFSELTAAINCYMKYTIFNQGDTPTNASVDMDDEGSNNILQSFFMRLL